MQTSYLAVIFCLMSFVCAAANIESKPGAVGITFSDAKQFFEDKWAVSEWQTKSTFLAPLADLHNSYAQYTNKGLDDDIAKFINGRKLSAELTKNEILYLGPDLVKAKSPLLCKLSPAQALAFFWIDPETMVKLLNLSLAPQTASTVKLLIRLCNEDTFQLSKSLQDQEILAKLKAEPLLIDALMGRLPLYDLNLHTLKSIKYQKSASTTRHSSSMERERENPFYYYSDPEISIITEQGTIEISRRRLKKVSARLREKLDDKNLPEIDLSHVNPEMIELLMTCINGDTIVIKRKNLWHILSTAKYFGLDRLIKTCDDVINTKGWLETMTEKWLEAVEAHALDYGDASAPRVQLEFCRTYQLEGCKSTMIQRLSDELNNLTMKNSAVLWEIMGLDSSEIERIFEAFDYIEFGTKLKSFDFLGEVWRPSLFIRPLREAIIQFLLNPENADVIKRTWESLPDELMAAMQYATLPASERGEM